METREASRHRIYEQQVEEMTDRLGDEARRAGEHKPTDRDFGRPPSYFMVDKEYGRFANGDVVRPKPLPRDEGKMRDNGPKRQLSAPDW